MTRCLFWQTGAIYSCHFIVDLLISKLQCFVPWISTIMRHSSSACRFQVDYQFTILTESFNGAMWLNKAARKKIRHTIRNYQVVLPIVGMHFFGGASGKP